jgi:hypothetical protein
MKRRMLGLAGSAGEVLMTDTGYVAVVAGVNSAGQAAVLRRAAPLRGDSDLGDDLYKNVSRYLVRLVEQTPRIELLCATTVRQDERWYARRLKRYRQ